MATKREVAESIAERTGLSREQALAALDAMLDAASDELASGGEVSLAGFGKFSVSHRAARQGRNPSTGQTINIGASRGAKFSAASSLKRRLNALPGEPDEYDAEASPGEPDED
jgi:DNA-binding protein HU-beta